MRVQKNISFDLRILRALPALLIFSLLIFCRANFAQDAATPAPTPAPAIRGKMPVIVIPGLIGSELVNKETGETVWFDLQRSKTDDLRLPISADLAANRDNLVPRDILRNIQYLRFLPEVEIYQRLASTLEAPGDYKEASWDAPPADGYQDVYYVYPYDWRRDNVENSRLLIRRINELKAKLKRPNLKFNIVGHSMGGLIARYAAMYGDADAVSGTRRPVPTWAGAAHINKIFLVGTPNEGSISSLDALIDGYALGAKGINLPFIQSLNKFDMFTVPAIFQLLPHGGTIRAYDENLKPLRVDIYNPETWEKYGWTAYTDPKFVKEFSAPEQAQAKAYFRAVLHRARRFHQALDANIAARGPVAIYLLGADCKPTLDAMIIRRDAKDGGWKTQFRADGFKRADGTKVSDKEVEELLFAKGDGVVTQRSFLTTTLNGARLRADKYKAALPARDISFACEVHNQLLSNAEVQNKLFADLISKEDVSTKQATKTSLR